MQLVGVEVLGVTEKVYVVDAPFTRLAIETEAEVSKFRVFTLADIPVESESIV